VQTQYTVKLRFADLIVKWYIYNEMGIVISF